MDVPTFRLYASEDPPPKRPWSFPTTAETSGNAARDAEDMHRYPLLNPKPPSQTTPLKTIETTLLKSSMSLWMHIWLESHKRPQRYRRWQDPRRTRRQDEKKALNIKIWPHPATRLSWCVLSHLVLLLYSQHTHSITVTNRIIHVSTLRLIRICISSWVSRWS